MAPTPLRDTIPGVVTAASLLTAFEPGVLDRLARRFHSFVFLLTNDTAGVEERAGWRLPLLVAWLAVAFVASPACLLALRLLGKSAELRRVAGVAVGVAAIQVLFFAVQWFIVAWGRRALDWAAFATSLWLAALVAKLAHEIGYLRSVAYVLAQSTICLAILFALAFSAAELGWIAY